jgi:flagellar biosynthetic protein FliO
MDAPPATVPDLPSMGTSLAVSFLSLGVVCAVAWLALRWLSRRGVGQGASGFLKVRARMTLEPRRSLYVVEAGARAFLVGTSEAGMSMLAELDAGAVTEGLSARATNGRTAAGTKFREVLAGLEGMVRGAGPRRGMGGSDLTPGDAEVAAEPRLPENPARGSGEARG